jgi:hypothetical protein
MTRDTASLPFLEQAATMSSPRTVKRTEIVRSILACAATSGSENRPYQLDTFFSLSQ